MKNKIEALEKFMDRWEELATSFYVELNKEIDKLDEEAEEKNLRMIGGPEYKSYRNKRQALSYKLNGLVTLNQIREAVAKERIRKENNFIARVEKVVGKVTDATDLKVADNLELNGVVIGEAGMPFAFQVRPETVGQYTGQMDKYGRKIFEGDLVKTCPSTITAKEGFPSKVFEVRLGFEMKWFGYKGTNSFYKIVGNIHDKKEDV